VSLAEETVLGPRSKVEVGGNRQPVPKLVQAAGEAANTVRNARCSIEKSANVRPE